KVRRYLVFEASTGSQDYQGEDQVYKWQNYGGTEKEAIENFLKITSNADMTSRGTWANAAIGIIRLSKNENNPKVDKVMPPLVSSLMVSDEIERANLIPMNGKYYLFDTTRLNRGTGDDLWQAADQKIGDNVAMLGWVSDHLTYGYKPLNDDAGVLVASVPFNWRTSTYSYYPVPVKGNNDELLVTSYMTNRGFAAGAGKRSTLAPSFLIKVDGDKTYVENVATNQGVWDYNKNSKNNSMLVSTIKGAHLDGEPIDKSQWNNKSLVSHIEKPKKKKVTKKVNKVVNKKKSSKSKPILKIAAPVKITATRRTPVVGKDGKQVKTYMGSKKYNVIGKNITVNGLGTQKINGKTYYILQTGYYVLANDFKLAGKLV
ncbi:MAG: glycoside hydrolase family 68 protein, partial [Lactobacillus sp.]|nr:glycoside hydrolase family 68 protein [Lactobacillus sp.]